MKWVILLFLVIFMVFSMWMKCLGVFCFMMLVDCSRNMNGFVELFMIGSLVEDSLMMMLFIFRLVSVDIRCLMVWILVLL